MIAHHTPRIAGSVALLLLVACQGIGGTAVASSGGATPPSVLLITVDDMNWDSVGSFGCTVPDVTPNIDELAAAGLRFEHGHVAIAICQPSRASLMTGRYPHRSGAMGFNGIHEAVPTVLEALHEAGYLTGILSKERQSVPRRHRAFDVIVPAEALGHGRDPDLYYRETKAFLERAEVQGKPFFLMANSNDPHLPFAGSELEQHPAFAGFPGVRRTYSPDEITVPPFLPDLPEVRQELSEYFASVHRADEMVGAVLRALSEAGRDEDTLVMFLSDHGMPLPFAKTNCWYNSTRTPWIVRWPGVVSQGRHDTEHFVSSIDFAPTVLDAVGLPPLEGMDGRSFLPVLRGEAQEGCSQVFTSINYTSAGRVFPMRSVQDAAFGYICNLWSDGTKRFMNESQGAVTWRAMTEAAKTDDAIAARVKHFLHRTPEELYDYRNDPGALHNLIDDPGHEARVEGYRREMLAQMRETDDPELARYEELLDRLR